MSILATASSPWMLYLLLVSHSCRSPRAFNDYFRPAADDDPPIRERLPSLYLFTKELFADILFPTEDSFDSEIRPAFPAGVGFAEKSIFWDSDRKSLFTITRSLICSDF